MFSFSLYFKYIVFSLLLAASLWGPYKDIWQTVMNAIWKRQPEAVHRLDQVLKKHKSDFISLFRNPVLDWCSLLEWAGELMIYSVLYCYLHPILDHDYSFHIFTVHNTDVLYQSCSAVRIQIVLSGKNNTCILYCIIYRTILSMMIFSSHYLSAILKGVIKVSDDSSVMY